MKQEIKDAEDIESQIAKDVLKFTIHLSVMGSIALLITYLMKL